MPYEKVGKNEPVCIADEVPFEIPESWEWVRLGTILHKLSDGTHSRPQYVPSGIPFISVKDVSGGKLDFSDCKYITEEEHRELYSRCNPERGDILLTKVGTTGIPVIVDTTDEFSLFVSVALLKFNQELLCNEYLVCLINSPLVQKQAEENTRGVGNKNWVMRDIANTLIVIPPLLEQQRIVSKLQEILSFADNYAQAYSKAEELNKSFPELLKKSILQEAVQGKLVPQDPTDEPASVLLDRVRAEKEQLIKAGKIKRDKHESVIFRRDNSHYEKLDGIERCIDDEIPFEIPESWAWTSVCEVCSNIQYGSSQKSSPSGKIAVLRMGNLQNGRIVLDKLVYTTDPKEIEKYPLEYNDLLFNRTNSKELVGKVAIYKNEIPAIYAGYLVRLHPILIDSDYLNYVMQSQYYWIYCQNVRSDAIGQSNINAEKLKRFVFPLPPLQEQRRIVAIISRIMVKIEHL